MLWGILCLALSIAAIGAAIVMSSGGGLNQHILYRIYERTGPQVYTNQEDTDWNVLIDRLPLGGHEHILDVGTAVGDLPIFLANKTDFHGNIVGIDWSANMIEAAKKRGAELEVEHQVHFEQLDVRDGLPYPKESFDVVICIGVLETIGDQAVVLFDLRRILKPDGILVLSRFRGWSNRSADRIQAWYERQFETFGMELESVLAFRPSHDLMIIRPKSAEVKVSQRQQL